MSSVLSFFLWGGGGFLLASRGTDVVQDIQSNTNLASWTNYALIGH